MAHLQTQGPTVSLVNKAHGMAVFNLPYEILGSGYMLRQVVGSLTWVYDRPHDALAKRARGGKKRLSKSMRLMGRGRPGSSADGLPPAIVRCPDVAGAIKAGTLQVIHHKPEPTRKPEPEALAYQAPRKARLTNKTDE